MSDNPFYKLTPFIQEYIYRNKWETLHEVQVRAIDGILNTPDHILISSGTASGKTEAALLPIITDIYENPPATIGVMYIGPLKALINDQFERITGLLEESGIPVQSWHGDVSQSKKERFLRRSQGIVQITPESLEAMLINRHHELARLFSELRYVVIDEIHAFIDSDRGRQVMCQLERLARFQQIPARRIGLSATLGEPQIAMDWLQGNTNTAVTLIQVSKGSKIEIGLEYFLLPDDEDEDTIDEESEDIVESQDNSLSELLEDITVYYEHLHRMTQRVPKTLIFANRRTDTEEIIVNLRQLSERNHLPSFYHVHHGSVSSALREAAEEAMRDETQKACVAATITLELGIDLGQLDQVLQVNSTHSVSSFVQRLGRSGRRGGPSRMFIYSTETKEDHKHIGEQLPWNLLQTIAMIQLYFEEKWVEPPTILQMPLSLLYHQTMSILKSHTELFPPQLAERLLTLSVFKGITQDHLRTLLHHLIEIEHIEQTDIGGLIVGIGAERLVNNYRFFATFADEVTFRVRDQSRELGTIQAIPEIGSTIGLAGFSWRVISVDEDKRVIYVEMAKGKVKTLWTGGGINIHSRILEKIRDISTSNSSYSYLHNRAKKRLEIARKTASITNLQNSSILSLAPNRFIIFPWCGTRAFKTQLLLLEFAGIKVVNSYAPYYYEVIYQAQTESSLKRHLIGICSNPPSPASLVQKIDELELIHNKYDQFVPETLLREAYAIDEIDISGAIKSFEDL